MTALAFECRVSSMAHVVVFGHVPGSVRLRTVVAHGEYVFIIRYPASPTVVDGVGR